MAAQKKLEKDGQYAHLDIDGDGVVTDEELDVDERIMRLENFFSYYKNQLIDRQKAVEESILSGLCKDWADYKYLTGKLAALNNELRELTDLLKKQELEDD